MPGCGKSGELEKEVLSFSGFTIFPDVFINPTLDGTFCIDFLWS